MALDLPLDVWTEILSYLSLKTLLLNTCTLSRLFLALSLDFLYQETYLASTDPVIAETFNTIIRDQLVANRVRRIYILSRLVVPSELGVRCDLFKTRNQSQDPQRKFNDTLIHLEDLRRLFDRKRNSPSPDARQEVARTEPNYTSKLVLSSVRELTITSENRNPCLNNVVNFLGLLWHKYHVGENLRKLKTVAGTVDTLLLLMPIIRYLNHPSPDLRSDCNVQSPRNPRLCSISIHFVPEFDTVCPSAFAINRSFSQLLEPLALTLTSFSLSFPSYPTPNISEVLEGLPYLPAVKEITFRAPFASHTMTKPGAVTEWLRLYQGQLEQLAIAIELYQSDNGELSDSDSSLRGPCARYTTWLTKADQPHYRGFPSLTFPKLRSLGVRSGFKIRQRILPPLRKITPSVRSLTLGCDDWLCPREIEDVLQGLQDGCFGLEVLRLRCLQLTPEMLDSLHERLPQLKVLEADCRRSFYASPGVAESLSKRKYTWKLRYLRIRVLRLLKHFHPDLRTMRALADCVECDPVLDVEYTCGCKGP